ncbi:MAG TPA: glycosyltransferase family 4 protein [Rhizomicrobium sp.]|jgi:glycosyltransferase involved in cell wall biosynthesis
MSTSNNKADGATGPAVLQLVPQLNSGGAERSTVDLAGALDRAGFRALVASEGGRLVPELEALGGEWIRMPLEAKSPLSLLANARKIAGLIRTRNISLLHARSRAPAWSALWAARRTGIPLVTTWHGAYAADLALKRFYNSVMLRGDAVIANSHWTAAHMRANYRLTPKKCVVIHRGVDTDRFDPARVHPERAVALRRSWGIAAEGVAVLLPGRLTRWKGQLVLIDAMARFARDSAGAHLHAVLAGDEQGGGYRAEIERAIHGRGIEHHVSLLEHIEDMPAAYAAADIVVSASTKPEAFGRVAAEAGAMARAVVATDHGGARETVLAGTSGVVVPPGDAEALADALRWLRDAGPEHRAAMGAAGRAHVLQNFTLARMTGDTLVLYREVLAAHSAAPG